MKISPPSPVASRLDYLRRLRDGWLHGAGVAPTADGLDWLGSWLERVFPDDLPVPYLYPTAEGAVFAEWSISTNECSLEVDLSTHQGDWHRLDLATDTEELYYLDLDDQAACDRLVKRIRGMVGVKA